jgi:hypothetical protein
MANAERNVHSRGSLALGGRFAGKSTRLLRSHPVIDRGSVFVAHLAFPVHTESEATAAVSALKRACMGSVVDHAMSAWRVPKAGTVGVVQSSITGKGCGGTQSKSKPEKPTKTKVTSDFDDDGESRGGAAIRAELNKQDAVGVAVVVTRAYGGVNLGKKRFEHIRERVLVLLRAAGIEPGAVASSDAFRGVGAGRTLGGSEGVAAALGGVMEGASHSAQQVAPQVQPRNSGASAGEINALFARRAGMKKKQKKTATKLPASVANDIRARLAEAAERRMNAQIEASRAAAVSAAQPHTDVLDLSGD